MKEQINRIKEKLKIAKKADKKLKVFGASNHKYALKASIEEKKLAALEKKYGVSLPAHFRAFLLEIADGGGGFGYYMGGSASELLQIYEEARNRGDTELKTDCLDALTHKAPRFETQILDKI